MKHLKKSCNALIEKVVLDVLAELSEAAIDVNAASKSANELANELLALYGEIVEYLPASMCILIFDRIRSIGFPEHSKPAQEAERLSGNWFSASGLPADR
jgi:hypothetical protein